MTEENRSVFSTSVKNQEEVSRLTERLLEVVDPDTVFSKPKKAGEYTVITASEVVTGLGSGYGYGSYTPPVEIKPGEDVEIEMEAGSGGGGGGGGMSSGRPVAVISIGPDGVEVIPVIDRTKLGIALLSAVGSMFLAMARFRK